MILLTFFTMPGSSSGSGVQTVSGSTVDNTDPNNPVVTAQAPLGYTPQNIASKDATGGYAGLTLFKINFKNAANTFISWLTNANTAARTYTFQDRDGTIADDTDLSFKANLNSPALVTPSLGTPSGGILTNCTGLPTTGVSGLTMCKSGQFDVNNSSTLVAVTGLTATLLAGKTYIFEAILYISAQSGEGAKFAINGTVVPTSIIYQGEVDDTVTARNGSRTTIMGNAVAGNNNWSVACARITGTIVVLTGGTLNVMFAQNTALLVTTSSVLAGSTFVVTQIN